MTIRSPVRSLYGKTILEWNIRLTFSSTAPYFTFLSFEEKTKIGLRWPDSLELVEMSGRESVCVLRLANPERFAYLDMTFITFEGCWCFASFFVLALHSHSRSSYPWSLQLKYTAQHFFFTSVDFSILLLTHLSIQLFFFVQLIPNFDAPPFSVRTVRSSCNYFGTSNVSI